MQKAPIKDEGAFCFLAIGIVLTWFDQEVDF